MITIQAGITLDIGPYKGATIQKVSKNGWCRCSWSDNRTFSARAHWLVNTNDKYTLIPN